ncbi:MAG: hypothetical protein E3K36_16465 [Candidatus Brocadia sp.]|nr:hypothetical protein [Candidatus Brocadia sp.]
MHTIKGLVVLLFYNLIVFVFVSPDFAQGNKNRGFVLPPDPGKAGKETLLGIDTDGDGVRDDIQRRIMKVL